MRIFEITECTAAQAAATERSCDPTTCDFWVPDPDSWC